MKTTSDVHSTPASLKKRLKGSVDERLVSSDPIDKKTFDLRLATVIAFYPKEDKCMVRMRNTGNPIVADLSHNIISHNINVGFTADGMDYKCTTTGYDAIKPYDIYTCIVLAIGGDFDHGGAVILNFITMSDSTFPDNPKPGSYLIQNQDSIIEVEEDRLSFTADEIQISCGINEPRSILIGGNEPSDDVGNYNDIYVNTLTWDLWYKYPYKWNLIGNIKGVSKEDIKNAINDMDELIATGLSEEAILLLEQRFMNKSKPVGTVYQNAKVNTNPYELFGVGTWQRVTDAFLYSINDNETSKLGVKSGQSTIALSTANLPSHTHIQNAHTHTQNAHSHQPSNIGTYSDSQFMTVANSSTSATNGLDNTAGSGFYANAGKTRVNTTNSVTPTINSTTATNQNTGSGTAFSIMPHHQGVYTWVRVL